MLSVRGIICVCFYFAVDQYIPDNLTGPSAPLRNLVCVVICMECDSTVIERSRDAEPQQRCESKQTLKLGITLLF